MGLRNWTVWSRPRWPKRRAAFTLVDVLVSIAVIAVLIAILLPSIAMVRESARRVVCGSNLRQLGLGLHMYAEDSGDYLPASVFLPPQPPSRTRSDPTGSPELMDTVRTRDSDFSPRPWGQWDGLGLLFSQDYVAAPKVFYCPSHTGNHGFDLYEDAWSASSGEIVSNYQFRGAGPLGFRRLYQIQSRAALVTDMLRSYEDLNHPSGFNVMQAGLAVSWFDDANDQIAGILLRSDDGGPNSAQVSDAWAQLDSGLSIDVSDTLPTD